MRPATRLSMHARPPERATSRVPALPQPFKHPCSNHHALSSTADSDDIPRRPPVRVASPYGLRAGAHLPVQRATPPWRPAGSSSLYPHGVDIFRISASHGNPDTLLRPGQQSNCVAAREPSPRRYPPELLRRLARSAGPSVSLARGRRQHSAKGVGGGLAGASTGLEAASVTPGGRMGARCACLRHVTGRHMLHDREATGACGA